MKFKPCIIEKNIIINWSYDKFNSIVKKYKFFIDTTYNLSVCEHKLQIKSLTRLLNDTTISLRNLEKQKDIAEITLKQIQGLSDLRKETENKNFVSTELTKTKNNKQRKKADEIEALKARLAFLQNTKEL